MDKVLRQECDSVKGVLGYWEIKYKKFPMAVITDEKNNRMRIIMPIVYLKELDATYYARALEANFHSVLDAKYAISEDIMWAVYIHPLKELSTEQLKDGLSQVYFAAATFGGSYSSTDLVFPAKKE